jgi:hypothetical protein
MITLPPKMLSRPWLRMLSLRSEPTSSVPERMVTVPLGQIFSPPLTLPPSMVSDPVPPAEPASPPT